MKLLALALLLTGCAAFRDAARDAAPRALPLLCDIVEKLVAKQCKPDDAKCREEAAAKVAAALDNSPVENVLPKPPGLLTPSPIQTANTKEKP